MTPRVARLLLSTAAAPLARTFTLLTFDVDGTLVKGSGQAAEASAHARAFASAVGSVLGDGPPTPLPAEALPGNLYHGSTDGLIVLRLAKAALGIRPQNRRRDCPKSGAPCTRTWRCSATRTRRAGSSRCRVRWNRCARSPGCATAWSARLVTGNVEGIARKKMRAVGVLATGALAPPAAEQAWDGENESAFLGGFGSDYCSGNVDDLKYNHLDRGEQIVIAARRARSVLPAGAALSASSTSATRRATCSRRSTAPTSACSATTWWSAASASRRAATARRSCASSRARRGPGGGSR